MRREYPEAPIVGVGAVVIDGTKVLLVRRGQEPLKGEWSLPGGALELGETLQQGVVREVLEEHGLIVVPGGHHRSIQHDAELQAVSMRFIDRAL